MKKAFLIVVPVLFALAIALRIGSYFFQAVTDSMRPISIILWMAAVIWSLIFVYLRGTFRKSVIQRLSFISIAVLIIGLVFKIQHWPGSKSLLVAGISLFGLLYIIHFLRKKGKKLLDWAKCLYIIATLTLSVQSFTYLPYWQIMNWVAPALGIVTFAIFYVGLYQEKEEDSFLLSGNNESVFKL